MPSPVVSFRANETVSRPLVERAGSFGGNVSEVAKTDLARYRTLLRMGQVRLVSENVLEDNEQALILDALNGVLLGEHPQLLAANISDAISLDGLDEKWEVYGLKEKLAGLTPLECAAVVDAAERFWARVLSGEDLDPRGGLFGAA